MNDLGKLCPRTADSSNGWGESEGPEKRDFAQGVEYRADGKEFRKSGTGEGTAGTICGLLWRGGNLTYLLSPSTFVLLYPTPR